MNKIIVVNKEKGLTSHDVVNQIRKIFNIKKVGHTGTLDPIAEGVLVVCIGDATKAVQFLESDDKEYEVTIQIGKTTDTLDNTGNITDETNVDKEIINKIDGILTSFIGKSKQIPPMYSAIKINGKKLYEYARKNIDVEIDERDIEIFNIERTSNIKYIDNNIIFSFKTHVSKGTYIRSLCRDIGLKLGYPAMMISLTRTRSGIFKLEDASTIDMIKEGSFKEFNLKEAIGIKDIIEDENIIYKALHGMKFSFSNIYDLLGSNPDKLLISKGDNVIAVYIKDNELHCYRALRVWN